LFLCDGIVHSSHNKASAFSLSSEILTVWVVAQRIATLSHLGDRGLTQWAV